MDGIDLMAGAMRAAKTRLDVAAVNLANVSTPGFARHVARVDLTAAGLRASITADGSEGPLRRTGRPLDLAVAGPGAFFVGGAGGERIPVKSASFHTSGSGTLVDDQGRALLGDRGPIHASADATIDSRGVVRDGDREAGQIALRDGVFVQSGFLEAPNVNAIREMVDVMSAQRSFETAQQTLGALDATRSKAVNDVVVVKG